MRSACRHTRSLRGSILFMILLAVVLFAALSYAVTNSIQGGSKDGSSESADAAAAEILQWFTAVDNAVLRMRLNGIAYEDMSFGYDAKRYDGVPLSNYMSNTRCTSDTCRIFRPDGGGVRPPDFSKYGKPNITSVSPSSLGAGYMVLYMMQWPGMGSSLNDVVARLWIMNGDVCRRLNGKLGITTAPGLAGTALFGHVVTSWDNPGYTFISNAEQMYGIDTFSGLMTNSGTTDEYCHISHVVIKR